MRYLLVIVCFVLLSPTLFAAEKPVVNSTVKKKQQLITTTETLFLRTAPSITAKKALMLAKGATVTINGLAKIVEKRKWIPVCVTQVDATVCGWVAAEYTAEAKASTTRPVGIPTFMHNYPPVKKSYAYPGNPPVKARGIYLTMFSAMKKRIHHFLNSVAGTTVNTFVIDVKNTNGRLLYRDPKIAKKFPKAQPRGIYHDISYIGKLLSARNIYAIARVPVFKDDMYALAYPEEAIKKGDSSELFEDRDSLHWVTPCSRRYWDYILTVAEGVAAEGFNEIQFDYVRLPDTHSKVDWGQCGTRREAIRSFLLYAVERLHKKGIYVSADVFGLVSSVNGDLHIGQYWEAISNTVDYISPMIYPSHYATGFAALAVPDSDPAKTVSVSVYAAVQRNKNIVTPAKIRPWIQDFTAFWVKGHIEYTEEEVRMQIRALQQHGIDEFLLWNPKNHYHYQVFQKDAMKAQ